MERLARENEEKDAAMKLLVEKNEEKRIADKLDADKRHQEMLDSNKDVQDSNKALIDSMSAQMKMLTDFIMKDKISSAAQVPITPLDKIINVPENATKGNITSITSPFTVETDSTKKKNSSNMEKSNNNDYKHKEDEQITNSPLRNENIQGNSVNNEESPRSPALGTEVRSQKNPMEVENENHHLSPPLNQKRNSLPSNSTPTSTSASPLHKKKKNSSPVKQSLSTKTNDIVMDPNSKVNDSGDISVEDVEDDGVTEIVPHDGFADPSSRHTCSPRRNNEKIPYKLRRRLSQRSSSISNNFYSVIANPFDQTKKNG